MNDSSKVNDKVIIYTSDKGNMELKVDLVKDTVWATQAEIANLFDVNTPAIVKHLKNIYRECELAKKSTCSKMEQVQIEGGRSIKRNVEYFNLDAIIAVGYRVNSKKATQFRIWATKVLREYLVNGYGINRSVMLKTPEKLEGLKEAMDLIESKEMKGKLKGKITIKLTKDLESR